MISLSFTRKIDKKIPDNYLEELSNIYHLYNPYVSTGVLKSKLSNFIYHLKKEGLIDNVEPINRGFSISIDDVGKFLAFYSFISKFIYGMDWSIDNENFVLYYAFE